MELTTKGVYRLLHAVAIPSQTLCELLHSVETTGKLGPTHLLALSRMRSAPRVVRY